MNFLNSGEGYSLFNEEANYDTYVDKTLMIQDVYRYATRIKKYICITRPRRFGKSVAANMIAAFFDESTAEKSRRLFERLEIGRLKDEQEEKWLKTEDRSLCWSQQGKHKVIRINMIDLFTEDVHSYDDFIRSLKTQVKEDLGAAYPGLDFNGLAVSKMLERTNDKFIFVIDEWDAIFEMDFMMADDKVDYLEFLKNLLKDKAYVHFAYMTGILPIAKYSSGSPLNMFHEFNGYKDAMFYPYFGLTEEEITSLMHRKGIEKPSIGELAEWYDGYVRHDGVHVYNPASVSMALGVGVCDDYWNHTGSMEAVKDMIRLNVQELKDDVIRMASGETLGIALGGFSSEKTRLSTRDEILSAMVVYGFLSYSNGRLCIPNKELLLQFRDALLMKEMGLQESLGDSRALLDATLARDEREIARLVEQFHDEHIPHVYYNDENSLACVVTLGYLAAKDRYDISREDKAGKGYADFIFTPRIEGGLPIIMELKYNHSAKNALECIHKRGYIDRFRKHKRVLLVGINYSTATKKHTCLTELVEQ